MAMEERTNNYILNREQGIKLYSCSVFTAHEPGQLFYWDTNSRTVAEYGCRPHPGQVAITGWLISLWGIKNKNWSEGDMFKCEISLVYLNKSIVG